MWQNGENKVAEQGGRGEEVEEVTGMTWDEEVGSRKTGGWLWQESMRRQNMRWLAKAVARHAMRGRDGSKASDGWRTLTSLSAHTETAAKLRLF